MILACPKMPGISLNITNVCVPKSLKHTLSDFKNPESAIWRQAFHFTFYSISFQQLLVVITSPFCSASKNFHQNDDRFAIKHSMQPMQCCMEGSIIIHHGIQHFFLMKYGFTEQKKRARMQIQGQNTQIHKVRPNAASVSH